MPTRPMKSPPPPPPPIPLNARKAAGVLMFAKIGDGVWGKSYGDMEMRAIQVYPSVYTNHSPFVVHSRELGGQWSEGTPYQSVYRATEAMESGGGIHTFKKWINGVAVD